MKMAYATVSGAAAAILRVVPALIEEYPDGWALSLPSDDLRLVLTICPPTTRVLAWVKMGSTADRAWEPVLVWGGRPFPTGERPGPDWVGVAALPKARERHPAFCYWLFHTLNLQPDDDFRVLDPLCTTMVREWENYRRQLALTMPRTDQPVPVQSRLA